MTATNPPPPPPDGPPAPAGPGAEEPLDDALLEALSPAEFQALRWSVRLADGLTPEAHAEFAAWLNADPDHRAAYEDMAGVWEAIDDIPPAGSAQIRASVAIDTAAQRAAQLAPASSPPAATPSTSPTPATPAQQPRPTRRQFAQALTSMAALGVLGGSGWLGWQHWQSQPVFQHRYATKRGQHLDVPLPDGSRLLLDSATQAQVTFYRQRREVHLPEGQVFFQVQADADSARPFDVMAGNARITVVGTQFSVRYTPSLGDQTVQVAVSQGRVRVASHGANAELAEAIVLDAGQALSAAADGKLGLVTAVPIDGIAPWRKRRLSFDGQPLAQVLAEISRYGDTGLHLRDPAVGHLPVTASVDLRNLGAFVQTLPQVLPVRLERREEGLEIVGR